MNTSEAFGPFLSFCQSERHVAPSTLSKYRDCFESWIQPTFGRKDVSEISRLSVLELRQAMVDRNLSVARQYSIIMFLKSFLKFCRSTLGVSCLDPADIKLPKRPAPHVEYLTNGEIQQVLDAIKTETFTGLRLRALIEVLLSTGMRISEALSLKRMQFDAGRTEAEIVGKGKKRRTIFFTQRCRLWVQEYLNRRIDDHPNVFVTTGYPVRPLAREDISRFFQKSQDQSRPWQEIYAAHPAIRSARFFATTALTFLSLKISPATRTFRTTARYYLGKNKDVLRRAIAQCLDYGLPRESGAELSPLARLSPDSLPPSVAPQPRPDTI